jgi:hypothetical protein
MRFYPVAMRVQIPAAVAMSHIVGVVILKGLFRHDSSWNESAAEKNLPPLGKITRNQDVASTWNGRVSK